MAQLYGHPWWSFDRALELWRQCWARRSCNLHGSGYGDDDICIGNLSLAGKEHTNEGTGWI